LKAPPHYSPRPSPIHGCNPKVCTKPGSGHQAVLTNPVRCCNAFAHTSTSPTSLDSRCSALGCEPEAPHNGQVIGAGQAAAPIHRIHHSNGHSVGCANIGRVRIPVSAACTVLGVYYLPPSDACSRHKFSACGGSPPHERLRSRDSRHLQCSPFWCPRGIPAARYYPRGAGGGAGGGLRPIFWRVLSKGSLRKKHSSSGTNPPGVSLNRLELKKQMRYFFREKIFCVLKKNVLGKFLA
jgi:hypothetical protein